MKRLTIVYTRRNRDDSITVHLKTQLSPDQLYKGFCREVPGGNHNGHEFAKWMEKHQFCDIPSSHPAEVFDIRKPLEF